MTVTLLVQVPSADYHLQRPSSLRLFLLPVPIFLATPERSSRRGHIVLNTLQWKPNFHGALPKPASKSAIPLSPILKLFELTSSRLALVFS